MKQISYAAFYTIASLTAFLAYISSVELIYDKMFIMYVKKCNKF